MNLEDLIDELKNVEKKPTFETDDLKKAEAQEKNLENRQKESEIKRFDQDTNHRGGLAIWAAVIVSIWLFCVLDIVAKSKKEYDLSETIIVTLLTTTTLNVLGLMVIVLNDLFNKAKK